MILTITAVDTMFGRMTSIRRMKHWYMFWNNCHSALVIMIIISISKSKRLKTLQRINEVAEESNQLEECFHR